MKTLAWMLGPLAATLVACAGAQTEPAGPVELPDDDLCGEHADRRGEDDAPPAVGDAPEAAPRDERLPPEGELAGRVARADLLAVLDAGPGAFLAGIEVRPVFRGSRFSGWEIERFDPSDARVGAAPLRPGDVVASVNRIELERPEDLHHVWGELRTAKELSIEGDRAGAGFVLRYLIVDDVVQSAP